MKRIFVLTLATLAIAGGCATTSPKARPGEQTPQALHKTVAAKRDVNLRYLIYLPKEYGKESKERWPLVIFLHGAGERGDDLEKLKLHGPPMLASKGKEFPFVLVSPQCPADSAWKIDDLDVLLDEILARYKIDADRVYVTGLSLGGWGTWTWITARPDRFAAAAPICGGGDSFLIGLTIKLPPVWAFHGEADKVVSPEESKRMIDAIRKHSGSGEAKLTIYPGVGHDSWKQAYSDMTVFDWLLSHRRSTNP